MKNKNTIIGIVIAVVIIIILFVVFGGKSSNNGATNTETSTSGVTSAPAIPVDTTTQVSSTTSSYQNDELGFSVTYPSNWILTKSPTGPSFAIPTVASNSGTMSASINTTSGACAFPPVATSTVKDKKAVTFGSLSFNMLSVASTVKGVNNAGRMYTLEQGTKSPICYTFAFGSTANKASDVTAADAAFTSMVKSFSFVTTPSGDSETAHPTGK